MPDYDSRWEEGRDYVPDDVEDTCDEITALDMLLEGTHSIVTNPDAPVARERNSAERRIQRVNNAAMFGAKPACDCGAADAIYHGPEHGLRVYCCDACWAKEAPKACEHTRFRVTAARVLRRVCVDCGEDIGRL